MSEPIWIEIQLALAIHERQLAEHGGGSGVRDEGMLESALARPQQKYVYGADDTDLVTLAAAYTFGLARNHPCIDGNKRTAAVACELFLNLNGFELVASDEDLYPVFMALAAGELDEEGFTAWLRQNARPTQVSEPAPHYG